MRQTITILNVELSFSKFIRFIPSIVILGFWFFVSINYELSVYDNLTMNSLCIVGFIVLSSYALDYGHKILGIFAIAIGFGAYYATYILVYTLSPLLLLQIPVIQTLAVLETSGKALILFGSASFGLWLSTTHFPIKLTQVKYVAIVVSALLIFIWIFGVTVNINEVIYSTLTIPGIELVYSSILIIASSLFVPRRKFLTVFFLVLGTFLTLWGISTFASATTMDSLLLGYSMRVIGTIFFILFALPLGASSITDEDHPENPLYIIIVLWIFAEFFLLPYLLIASLIGDAFLLPFLLIFSPARVFALYAIIYFSMKALKIKRPVLTGIGTLIGFGLTAFGMLIFLVGLFSFSILLLGGLCLSVIGYVLLLFCSFSFGEAVRIRLIDKGRLTSGIGLLLILLGVIAGTVGISSIPTETIPPNFDPLFFIYLDTIFFALVSLGSMFIVIKPRRIVSILAAFGFANIPIVLLRSSFMAVQFFAYPLYALMIFFLVQQLRVSRDKVEQSPQKKKSVPMKITPETLIKSGLYKEPTARVEQIEPVESIDPVESRDSLHSTEADTQIEPTVVEKPIDPVEPVEIEVSEKFIKTVQQKIPVLDGVVLPDNQRMARNWYNRAFEFLKVGDLEGAIKTVETALKWQPDHRQALTLKKELLEK